MPTKVLKKRRTAIVFNFFMICFPVQGERVTYEARSCHICGTMLPHPCHDRASYVTRSAHVRGVTASHLYASVFSRLGFLGNHPFSTRFFCSKSSPIDQRQEAPITPTMAEARVLSMQREPTIQTIPAKRKSHQGRVPK